MLNVNLDVRASYGRREDKCAYAVCLCDLSFIMLKCMKTENHMCAKRRSVIYFFSCRYLDLHVLCVVWLVQLPLHLCI